jgi:predicted CXXCH cytochrome family protein
MRKLIAKILVFCCAGLLAGCDAVTLHKVASTIFDGVPSLPPAEQYCQDFHEEKLAEAEMAASTSETAAVQASKHAPYAEKRCDDCHDKSQTSGLVRPKEKLCFMCHPDILAGANVHGPAAVGDCLACHEPHSSSQPSLLKLEKAQLCSYCHKERRVADAMHQRLTAKGMLCMDCHDPHAGNGSYFLK